MTSKLIGLYNADERYIKNRFEFYFDGEDKPPTVFSGDDYVMNSTALNELAAESQSPLGAVSSNEFTITFINNDKTFTPNNTESTLYGKLVPNIKVVAYYTIEDETGTFVDTKIGTYFTTSWKAVTGSMEAEVICNDMLYTVGERDIPSILPEQGMVLKDMITKVLTEVGLKPTEYSVDDSLTYKLEFVWFPKVKLRAFLQSVADGYGCIVYVNEDGKLIIEYNRTHGTSVSDITDSNQLVSLSVPQELMSLYSRVELTYYRPQVSEKRVLIEMKDIALSQGINVIRNIMFENAPVIRIDTISIEDSVEADVIDWSYDSWGMTVAIDLKDSNTDDKLFTIKVHGYVYDKIEQKLTVENNQLGKIIGERTLKITSDIVQDYVEAYKFADHILTLVSNLDTYVDAEWWVNPAIRLGSVVEIKDATNNVNGIYTLYRSEFTHDGALSGNARFVKVVI